ncbi:hypothetical protein GCM10009739_10340 [Microbacterium ulmi]
MLVAMTDAAVSRFMPTAAWVGLLLAGGVAIAIAHRIRRGRGVTETAVMTAHTALGMVVMAGLLAGMTAPAATVASDGHAHGGAGLGPICAVAAVAYAAGSAAAARRACARGDRLQYAAMGVATLAMGAAALV